MKRIVLRLATLTLTLGGLAAHAQDKAKGELTYSADYRVRDTFLQHETGTEAVPPAHSNRIDQRLRINLSMRPSERLGAQATLLGNMQFGQSLGERAGEPTDSVSVNQAFAGWMISDDVSLKAGRMNYQIGDGFTMGINEWEGTPYAFDGALLNYEFDFGRIQVFGFKIFDYGPLAVAGGQNSVSAPDYEQNAYGLVFELKTPPEFIKYAGLHVIKDTGDLGESAPAAGSQVQTVKGTQGMDIVRYGANAQFAYGPGDLKLWYAGESGKNRFPDDDSLVYNGTYEVDSYLMAAELGVNFPDWYNARGFVQYHVDSGDGDSEDERWQTYDSFFHVKHGSAGLMDLFDWGNLTSLQVGYSMRPIEALDVGVSYWMLMRTETGDTSARPLAGLYGGNLTPATGTNDLDLGQSKLGDEIDLWAEYRLQNGLVLNARAGYFIPGGVYDASRVGGRDRTDEILQLMFEGKVAF